MEDVRFRGDFLGNLPAEDLATRLQGLRFERDTINRALESGPEKVSSYFDGLQASELLDAVFAENLENGLAD